MYLDSQGGPDYIDTRWYIFVPPSGTLLLRRLQLPYHKAILDNRIPLSIGGGIGQSRTFMLLLLKKAHIGEVSATVWPKVLKEMCRKKNIHVIE